MKAISGRRLLTAEIPGSSLRVRFAASSVRVNLPGSSLRVRSATSSLQVRSVMDLALPNSALERYLAGVKLPQRKALALVMLVVE